MFSVHSSTTQLCFTENDLMKIYLGHLMSLYMLFLPSISTDKIPVCQEFITLRMKCFRKTKFSENLGKLFN